MCPSYGPILVVGAERMSGIMARLPRRKETAILFGDGAGACIVAAGEGPVAIQDCRMESDGTFAEDLTLGFGGTLEMHGHNILVQANRKLRQSIEALLARNGLQVDDIGLWLFHQANGSLLRQVAQAVRIPEDRVFLNLAQYGNTSSASILIAAAEARAQGRLGPGYAVMAAFGAGLGWGSALLRIR